MACAILKRISGLEPSSETIALKVLVCILLVKARVGGGVRKLEIKSDFN